MKEILFELKDAHFSYLGRYPALCGITMNITRQEKIVIIGANGTGKSTLLQMLDGLIFPDKGSISVFGRKLQEDAFSEVGFSVFFRSRVGLVFQNPDIQLFCPTVKEDIIFGPLQLGVKESEIAARLDRLTNIFHLAEFLNRPPHQLSIGEKRKVAIASVLAIEPEVLILDEPTAGLDPLTSRQIIDILLELNQEGKTIITATHDLHIVEEISDRVYVLGLDRKIACCGPARELLTDREMLLENNLIHIHRHRHKDTVHVHDHSHLIDHHPQE